MRKTIRMLFKLIHTYKVDFWEKTGENFQVNLDYGEVEDYYL
ncbi:MULTISPECIES: hypothetical protein [unclassified Okeania]|nr:MULTISPECIES: hypothetical protein [unclassified Okeania]